LCAPVKKKWRNRGALMSLAISFTADRLAMGRRRNVQKIAVASSSTQDQNGADAEDVGSRLDAMQRVIVVCCMPWHFGGCSGAPIVAARI
jgi:hypothetical protein